METAAPFCVVISKQDEKTKTRDSSFNTYNSLYVSVDAHSDDQAL